MKSERGLLMMDGATQEYEDKERDFDLLNLGGALSEAQRFYFQMRLIRELETLLLDLFSRNQLFGTTHTCIGQECNAVAVMEAIDRTRDMVFSNHRCHGHFLAYCGQAEKLLAEIMGKPSGVCGGRGGSQHLHWRNFVTTGIQGGLLPSALGAAKAELSTGVISVAFIGDGTMGEGIVYECLNLATLWSLPVLFVVEDNAIAQTTPRTIGVGGTIARRAEPFGVRCFSIDSSDVAEIAPLAREAVAYVRNERKPAWLHISCVRLGPHSKGDESRPQEEIDLLCGRDPLTLHRPRVENAAALDEQCRKIVADALIAAEKG
jgi:TPP-dependent pyruvate/acetoin dehydrogenase alpha subunit